MSSLKKITLRSSDKEIFEVEEVVALQAQTIKQLIEVDCADGVIPLANVDSKTLVKVIEYCNKHADAADKKDSEDALKTWDAEFANVDQNTLYHLMMAANYLNIRSLLDLLIQTVADMIKAKSPEEIRKILNIKNDFTPEEEEVIRRENPWAFE